MNVRKIAIASLGAALLAGASIPAFAAPPPPPGPAGEDHPGPEGRWDPNGRRAGMMKDMVFLRLLKSADTNKDAKISKDEFTTWEDQLFTQIDANKDGFVTRGELLDYRTARMEEYRKAHPEPQADEPDGKPDPATLGADEDGPRDHDKGPGPHRHGDRNHDRREGRDKHPRGPMMSEHGPMMGPRFFRMIDEDHDGKISKAEAAGAADKLFALMDTNKDGQITIDDLPDRPF
jgi:Ca2+-binding EF-hand superfamily protein